MTQDDRMETITDPEQIRATDEPDERTTPAPVGAAVAPNLDALHETICDKFTGMAEVRQSADLLLAEVRRLTRWQFEAMSVMAGLQGLGSALGMRLGESITGHAAAEAARALTARAEAAEVEVVTLRARLAAVEAVHRRVISSDRGDCCSTCDAYWPCRTIAALATTGEAQR